MDVFVSLMLFFPSSFADSESSRWSSKILFRIVSGCCSFLRCFSHCFKLLVFSGGFSVALFFVVLCIFRNVDVSF